MKFSEFNLNENLLKGIDDAGFSECMPVQAEALTHTLKAKDAMVQSQTGTGKTAAFLITILQHMLDENSPIQKKRALIITPTRELAAQIEKDAKLLTKYLDITVGSFYGGVGYAQQEKMLADKVDIMVGTPGRLLDFSYKGKVDFNSMGFVVIDEADRMFDMGFLQDIRQILDRVSSRLRRMFMLFSATLDARTKAVAYEYMKDPAIVAIQPEQVTVDKITQILYHVAEKEKLSLTLGILKKELPQNALVFTNTRHAAAHVAKHLDHNGYKCQYLNGDLPQSKRLRVINSFKAGKLQFLVATDVAARGLHIEDLEMVINYDLPGDCENYVHRIGRTARVGKSGKAITLGCEHYIYNLEAIEAFIGMKIPVQYADEDLYMKDTNGQIIETRDLQAGGEKEKHRGRSASGRSRRSTRTTRSSSSSSRPQRRKTTSDKRDDIRDDKRDDRRDDRRDNKHDDKRSDRRYDKKSDYKKSDKKHYNKKSDAKKYEDRKKDDGTPEERKKKSVERSYNKTKVKGKHPAEHKEPADRRHPTKKKSRNKSSSQPASQNKGKGSGKRGNLEDRLEYYKKKYGDNFQVKKQDGSAAHTTPPPPKKKSFIKRIANVFKRNK